MCQVSLTYRGTVTQCLNFSSPYHGSWNLGGPGGWWLERVWLGFGNKQDRWEELFPCVYRTLFFFPFGFESPIGNKQTPGTETHLFCPMFSMGFDLTGYSHAKRALPLLWILEIQTKVLR